MHCCRALTFASDRLPYRNARETPRTRSSNNKSAYWLYSMLRKETVFLADLVRLMAWQLACCFRSACIMIHQPDRYNKGCCHCITRDKSSKRGKNDECAKSASGRKYVKADSNCCFSVGLDGRSHSRTKRVNHWSVQATMHECSVYVTLWLNVAGPSAAFNDLLRRINPNRNTLWCSRTHRSATVQAKTNL